MSLGRLTKEERTVLNYALEHYVRLGLGQFTEIAARLDMLLLGSDRKEGIDDLHELMNEAETRLGGSWEITDPEVSRFTLLALLMQSRLNDDEEAVKWLTERLQSCKE